VTKTGVAVKIYLICALLWL